MHKEHEPDLLQDFEDDDLDDKVPAKYRELLESDSFEKFRKSSDWWD
jgi:hypothetical protein